MMQDQAKEQEDEGKDETDHEGLDVRPCLGEQDPDVLEQERQRLEDLARSGEEWDSEAEELAFKNKVSAVTRERPPASRMFLVPKPRFKPAVGGAGGQQGPAVGGQDGGVDVSMDMRLHLPVLSTRGGTQDFGLQEMTRKYDGNKYFVPWMSDKSITRKFDILQREPHALKGSDMGGWRLCDELADTDVDGGKAMSREKFMNPSRWQGDTALVLKHLFKKHEGELVEVEGKWVEGTGDIPDPLFDPQFTQNKDDFKLCESLDQPLAISRSQYSHSYLAKGKVHRGGKGKRPERQGQGGGARPATASRWRQGQAPASRWRQTRREKSAAFADEPRQRQPRAAYQRLADAPGRHMVRPRGQVHQLAPVVSDHGPGVQQRSVVRVLASLAASCLQEAACVGEPLEAAGSAGALRGHGKIWPWQIGDDPPAVGGASRWRPC